MHGDEASAQKEAAERDRTADASDRGQRLQVALAEFSALRTELQGHSTAQGSLIALVVTAIGIVAGLVIKEGGDPRLLLILPALVSAAGIHLLGSVVPLVAVHFAHMPPTAAQEAAGEAVPRVLDPDLRVLDVYRGVWWLGVALTAVYVGTAVSAMRSSGPLKATDECPTLDQLPAYSEGGERPRSSPAA